MRPVALLLSISLLGCFANPRHRTYAQVAEGVAIVGGIVLLAAVNTGADCEDGFTPDQDCEDRSRLVSNLGLGLILAGMIGFIVTVSTAPDDDATTSPPAAPPSPAPASSTPPASGTPAPATDAGSAAPPTTP